jgi:PqqD family protein of HPr-rel-A system
LRWFDDGVVVFDEATGSLHALEPAAAMALERILSGGDGSAASLVQWLAQTHGVSVDTDTLDAWLDAFVALNFVCSEP